MTPKRTIVALWATAILATLALAQSPTPQAQQQKALATLQSDAPLNEKQAAFRQLAQFGDKDAIPAIAKSLPDEKLSHMARVALEAIPDPAADDALRAAAAQLKGKLLVGVVNSIGVRRDAKAVDALAKLLADPDPEVASAAAAALGRIGDPAAIRALESVPATVPEALRAAVCDGYLRAADALLQAGRPEAAAMYDTMRTAKVPAIRIAALRGAILSRKVDGLPLLLEQLKTGDPDMLKAALRVAHEIPGPAATTALAAAIKDLPADRQVLVIQVLGNRKDPAALPTIMDLAKSATGPLQLAALRVLPQLGSASAVPALFDMALGQGEPAKAAQAALVSMPGKEVDDAIMAAAEKDAKLRRIAIEVLAQRHIPAAVPLLLKAAADDDEQVRLSAIKGLSDVATVEQVPQLAALLTKAKSPQELDAAEKALSATCVRVGNPDACATALVTLLPQATPAVKSALLRTLGSVGGPKSLSAVRDAVKDADPAVKATAVRRLCEWPTPDAADDLLAMAKTWPDATEKLLALRGHLRLSGDKSLPEDRKLAMCQEATPLITRDEERRLLLGVLAGIGSKDALSLALPHLDSANLKNEAGSAIVAIAEKLLSKDRPSAADALKKVIDSKPNEGLLRRATDLLTKAQAK